MIKFMTWNIRGLGNGPSTRRLKYLISLHKISCFAIFEPKFTKSPISDYELKLNCHGSVSNLPGSIWVFWKSNIQCTVMQNTRQLVTLQIDSTDGLSF